MKEGRWMSHDWQPTVSEPEEVVGINEVKDLYLELLHQKLKARVDAGEISQSKMDILLVEIGLNMPAINLFTSEDVKNKNTDQLTVKRANVELMAEIMANAEENKNGSDDVVSTVDAENNDTEVN